MLGKAAQPRGSVQQNETSVESPLLDLGKVSRVYRAEGGVRVRALKDVSLQVHAGEFVCITGPSGAGKSTLMNIIGCMDQADSGSYRLAGREVQGFGTGALALLRRRFFGFVFQAANLLESYTASQNVQLPGLYAGMSRSRRQRRATELLSSLDLATRAEHLPSELSGGEQQRVAVARALMNGGRVILADEPTGALDRENGEEVLKKLEHLTAQGHTVIVVSHNPEVAARARRQIALQDGRLVSDSGGGKSALPGGASREESGGQGTPSAILELVRGSWTALRANLGRGTRLHTLLPILCIGIAVCVGAMTISLSSGVYRQASEKINSFGLDAISIYPTPGRAGPDRPGRSLTHEDVAAIENQIGGVRAISPSLKRYGVGVRYGGANAEAQVNGFVDRGSQTGRGPSSYLLESGAPITQQEDDSMAQVAVIGATTRKLLFPSGIDPVGEVILIENRPFRVKGVLRYRSGLIKDAPSAELARELGDMVNNEIFVPYKTAAFLLFESETLSDMVVFMRDPDQVLGAASQIRDLLISRLGDDVFFLMSYPGEASEKAMQVRTWLWLGLGSIAIIALLAGNLVVMNAMLVSVSARKREIGIRLAVGARRRDISRQFLAEAVTVNVAGGLLGALLALTAVIGLQSLYVAASISLWMFVAPFACSAIAGALFGIAPARRAARLTPVVALASE